MLILSKNKIIKSVGFNITNEEDTMILAAVQEKNFSAYVKELILSDLQGTEKGLDLEVQYNGPLRIVQRTDSGGIRYDCRVTPLPQQPRVPVGHS